MKECVGYWHNFVASYKAGSFSGKFIDAYGAQTPFSAGQQDDTTPSSAMTYARYLYASPTMAFEVAREHRPPLLPREFVERFQQTASNRAHLGDVLCAA